MADEKVVDPHAVDEDPEKCIGEELADPWADDGQDDWPNNADEEDA